MTIDVIAYQHARDIPDAEFLRAVRNAGIRADGTGWANYWGVQRALGGYPLDAQFDGDVPGVPYKVVLAKFRRLQGRGLLDGCGCGCRGDFELTEAGMAALDAALLGDQENQR